jgi:ribosomal protein L15
MDELEREVKIGVSGDYLEKKAQELITKAGGKCNFKG